MTSFTSSVHVPSLPPSSGFYTPTSATQNLKLSEKSLELTFCAQFGWTMGVPIVWIGLTQKQERQYGFDMASNFGGRAVLLQFKASATVRNYGRRFHVNHGQLVTLSSAFHAMPHTTFYVFPNVGRIGDLVAVGGDLVTNTYLADVATFPSPIPVTHRAKNLHYADLLANPGGSPSITFHSDSFAPHSLIAATELARALKVRKAGTETKALVNVLRDFDGQESGHSARFQFFFRNAAMFVVP
jgi:hypothetical protein